MESSREPTQITLSMEPADAYEFLRKLAYDDDFRQELREDPDGVLRREGIDITGGHGFESTVQPPPKREVRDLLEDLDAFDDELGRVKSHESIGFGLFAIVFRLAHAMPFIDLELELAGDAAN